MRAYMHEDEYAPKRIAAFPRCDFSRFVSNAKAARTNARGVEVVDEGRGRMQRHRMHERFSTAIGLYMGCPRPLVLPLCRRRKWKGNRKESGRERERKGKREKRKGGGEQPAIPKIKARTRDFAEIEIFPLY